MVEEPIKALQHIPCIVFALIMTFNDEILNFMTVLTKNLTSKWHDMICNVTANCQMWENQFYTIKHLWDVDLNWLYAFI